MDLQREQGKDPRPPILRGRHMEALRRAVRRARPARRPASAAPPPLRQSVRHRRGIHTSTVQVPPLHPPRPRHGTSWQWRPGLFLSEVGGVQGHDTFSRVSKRQTRPRISPCRRQTIGGSHRAVRQPQAEDTGGGVTRGGEDAAGRQCSGG